MSLHPGSSPFLTGWLMETKPYKLVEGHDGARRKGPTRPDRCNAMQRSVRAGLRQAQPERSGLIGPCCPRGPLTPLPRRGGFVRSIELDGFARSVEAEEAGVRAEVPFAAPCSTAGASVEGEHKACALSRSARACTGSAHAGILCRVTAPATCATGTSPTLIHSPGILGIEAIRRSTGSHPLKPSSPQAASSASISSVSMASCAF